MTSILRPKVVKDGLEKWQDMHKLWAACSKFGVRMYHGCSQDQRSKSEVRKIIDKEKDSLRFYNLGNNYRTKVEHIGAKPSLDLEGILTL